MYETVVGLEIHAEIKSDTKIFCGCKTSFGAAPNSLVCPVCMGYPGALPSLNKQAVIGAVKAGISLDCSINNLSSFDRKNYFYPDLPKGYQITQFYRPICEKGFVKIGEKIVGIERIHIEEDAGKLVHKGDKSIIDFNRCGIPLIEIVTAPDMRSGEEAASVAEEIALRLKQAGVCEVRMEQGNLRIDVNVSVRPEGCEALGTRTEIKNLNSFRNVAKAVKSEAARQVEILNNGGEIDEETMHFNESSGATIPMRKKESYSEYRYFPEADLPPLYVSKEEIEAIKAEIPELPQKRRIRLKEVYSVNEAEAERLTKDTALCGYFEGAAKLTIHKSTLIKFLLGEVLGCLNERQLRIDELRVLPKDLAELIDMIETGEIQRAAARKAFIAALELGGSPKENAQKLGLLSNNNLEEIKAAVENVIVANERAVSQFKSGEEKVFGFLLGRAMRDLGGRANPNTVSSILMKKLEDEQIIQK